MKKSIRITIGHIIAALVFLTGFIVLSHSDTSTFIGVMLIMGGKGMLEDIRNLKESKE